MVSGPCRPRGHVRQQWRRAPAYWRKAGRRHHYRRSFRPGRPDRGAASRHRLNGFPRRTGAAKSGGIMTDTTGQLDKTFNPAAIEARWYRSEEHTSELQSLMRLSYAVFCLKKKQKKKSKKNYYYKIRFNQKERRSTFTRTRTTLESKRTDTRTYNPY